MDHRQFGPPFRGFFELGAAFEKLDQSLDGGFRPGMGHVLPERMFWALPEEGVVEAHGEEPPEADIDAGGVRQ